MRFLLEGKLKVRFLLVCFWRRVLCCYIFALVRFSRHPKLFFFSFQNNSMAVESGINFVSLQKFGLDS